MNAFVLLKSCRKIKRKVELLTDIPGLLRKAEPVANQLFSDEELPPVIVYQMGKVGSRTIVDSLQSEGLPNPVLHLHFISEDITRIRIKQIFAGVDPLPEPFFLGEAIRKILPRKCRIITLVRDPIAIIISNIFENPLLTRQNIFDKDGNFVPDKLLSYVAGLLKDYNDDKYIETWFDRELKRVFKIDVFSKPFPSDVGYSRYERDEVEVLLIRLEDLTEKGPVALAEFLNLDQPVKLSNSNVRVNSEKGDLYTRIIKECRFSRELCENVYSKRLTQHFYSQAMIEGFIKKWSR